MIDDLARGLARLPRVTTADVEAATRRMDAALGEPVEVWRYAHPWRWVDGEDGDAGCWERDVRGVVVGRVEVDGMWDVWSACGMDAGNGRAASEAEGRDAVDGCLRVLGLLEPEPAATATCPHEEAVFWNPYNRVVQCHRCGQVFEPTMAGRGGAEGAG